MGTGRETRHYPAGLLPPWGLLPAPCLWTTHRATGSSPPPPARARKLQSFVVLVTAPLGRSGWAAYPESGQPGVAARRKRGRPAVDTVQVQATLAISGRRRWVSCG